MELSPSSAQLARLTPRERDVLGLLAEGRSNNAISRALNVHERTIEELWFGDRHQDLVVALQQAGGRRTHEHCLSCPRP